MEKLIITVALTGNVPNKETNKNVPIMPDEIAHDVRRCTDAGAALFHVHARDAHGLPTLDISAYKANVRKIKEVAPEVIIQQQEGVQARIGRPGQIPSVCFPRWALLALVPIICRVLFMRIPLNSLCIWQRYTRRRMSNLRSRCLKQV